jgi:lysozyme
MADFSLAINLIRKYEGFNEKAYPDPSTGKEPYTIGYGTQFYPDGAPVKAGQYCTKEKALEYLFNEINVIEQQLNKLNLDLDNYMQQALISFIHSIGWEPFLYSQIIDCMEQENISGVCEEIGRWIFNEKYQAIGGLLDRRREEISLFVTDLDIKGYKSTSILLKAFNDFTGKGNQFKAIQRLEEGISPYLLTEFSNDFNENPEKVYEYFGYDFVISV